MNYAGHLGNDSLISIIQEARIQLFKELGFTEMDLGDGKTGVILGDIVVNFKAEGFPNDELKIESQIKEVTDKSIRVFHRVIKKKHNELLALVETGLIAFDYVKREPTNWPDKFRLKLLEISK